MKILAIETSCDETSSAVISEGKVLSNVISSQLFHKKWGGVVPELASRAHLKHISSIIKNALRDAHLDLSEIDAIAVTQSPGLIGSLVVGTSFAKGLAIKFNLPIIPVNHIEGHIYSGCIFNKTEFPFISLVVSGGHTSLFLVKSFNEYMLIGSTRDDAAGEAFDKIGKMLGLDYPAGPKIDELAKKGDPDKYIFPRSMIDSGDFDFSFSGLKTSVRNFLNYKFNNKIDKNELLNICAGVQEAIVDVLVSKTICSALNFNVNTIAIAGGVSANSRLRHRIAIEAQKNNMFLTIPEFEFCMDNAGMIGFISEKRILEKGKDNFLNFDFVVSSKPYRSKYR